MIKKNIPGGVVHDMPEDLMEALTNDPGAFLVWEDLTPLARNEWICWVTFVKRDKTRKEHIKRSINELRKGKRRPCCWMGCIHRTDKPISPYIQNIVLNRQRKEGTSK